jgi:hypothetical protein
MSVAGPLGAHIFLLFYPEPDPKLLCSGDNDEIMTQLYRRLASGT